MSENVPVDVQLNILKRLPIRSLIQFRSVSKSWKLLIDSSDFIRHYSSDLRHLLVCFRRPYYYEGYPERLTYFSFADDDNFPQHKVSLNPPLFFNMLESPNIIGSSHGLLCLIGDYSEDDHHLFPTAVICNMSIRKAVAVVLPDRLGETTLIGFGVCPVTTDPKIVKFTATNQIPCQVDVFTLSTGVWRSLNTNLPRICIKYYICPEVVTDGYIYWLAFGTVGDHDAENEDYFHIISFDLTSEEFREVNLPDNLAHCGSGVALHISKLRNSLVVLQRDEEYKGFFVWMMEDGVPRSFTKLFHIYTPDVRLVRVREFRMSGEPIIQICKGYDETFQLVVYDPQLERVSHLVIDGFPLDVHSYTESLLLLDQPDYIVYDAMLGTRYISKRTDANTR